MSPALIHTPVFIHQIVQASVARVGIAVVLVFSFVLNVLTVLLLTCDNQVMIVPDLVRKLLHVHVGITIMWVVYMLAWIVLISFFQERRGHTSLARPLSEWVQVFFFMLPFASFLIHLIAIMLIIRIRMSYTQPTSRDMKDSMLSLPVSTSGALSGSPTTVLLFLAHDGIIAQPAVWQAWLEVTMQQMHNDGLSGRLLFVVHAPHAPNVTQDARYKSLFLWLGDASLPTDVRITMGPTSWCSPSIVYEQLRSYRSVCALFFSNDSPGCICQMSGTDFPIREGSILFTQAFQERDNVCATGPIRNYHQEIPIPSFRNGQFLSMTSRTAQAKVRELFDNDESAFQDMAWTSLRDITNQLKCVNPLDNMWFVWNLKHLATEDEDRCISIRFQDYTNSKDEIQSWKQLLSLWRFRQKSDLLLFVRKVSASFRINQKDMNLFLKPMWLATDDHPPQLTSSWHLPKNPWGQQPAMTRRGQFWSTCVRITEGIKLLKRQGTYQESVYKNLFRKDNYDFVLFSKRFPTPQRG